MSECQHAQSQKFELVVVITASSPYIEAAATKVWLAWVGSIHIKHTDANTSATTNRHPEVEQGQPGPKQTACTITEAT